MLYLLSVLSVMYILLMYYISLLLLPPDGFVLCYIGLLVLTLWRFDDDVISPSPGKGCHNPSRDVGQFVDNVKAKGWKTSTAFPLFWGLLYQTSLGFSGVVLGCS